MSGDGWDELLGRLDDDEAVGEAEWGTNFTLQVGDTFVGWYLGVDTWNGDFGETPVWLFRDRDGNDVFHWGGRKQLDKKLANASPNTGDRIALRREEDAPAAEGRSPAWRIRVAVLPGEGSMPEARTDDTVAEPAAEPDNDDDLPF